VLDSMEAQQLQSLGVLAGADVDGVPALAKQGEQRPEERDLGRVRDVDPDPHAPTTLANCLHDADQSVYIM
jgi:hypothetical protein